MANFNWAAFAQIIVAVAGSEAAIFVHTPQAVTVLNANEGLAQAIIAAFQQAQTPATGAVPAAPPNTVSIAGH